MFPLLFVTLLAVFQFQPIAGTPKCGYRSVKSPPFLASMITGNQTAKPGELPWVVYIESRSVAGDWACTGTIIGERHVLTAAHCVPPADAQNLTSFSMTIKTGSNLEDKSIQTASVKRGVAHEEFTETEERKNAYLNDIGVLELKEPLKFDDNVQPVCLPPKQPKTLPKKLVGKQAYIAGFGWATPGDCTGVPDMDENLLHKGTVSIVRCGVDQRGKFEVCAHGKTANVRHGDSGGGLLMPAKPNNKANQKWTVIGITSGRDNFCSSYDPKNPETFTYVQSYCDWLAKNTDGNVKCPEKAANDFET